MFPAPGAKPDVVDLYHWYEYGAVPSEAAVQMVLIAAAVVKTKDATPGVTNATAFDV